MPQIPNFQDDSKIKALVFQFSKIEEGVDISLAEDDYIELINFYLTENKNKKAFIVLNKALKCFPNSFSVKLAEAQLLIEAKLNTAASKKLKKLYKISPNDMGLLMLIGINYTKLAVFNKAMMFFDKAVSLLPDASKDILLYTIAQNFIQNSRYDIASYYLMQGFQLSPNDDTIAMELAFCFEKNGNYEKAEKLYKFYLKRNPFSKLGWYNFGVVLVNMQKVDEAIEAFDFAIAIDDEFSSPIYNKADLLFQLKKYKPAIEEFTKLLKIETDNSEAFLIRSECHFNLNQHKKALKDIKKSLSIDKENSLAWFNLAKIYYENNDIRKAKKALYHAIQQDRLNAKYWRLTAKVFIKERNENFVDKSFRQAVYIDPFTDDLWFEYSAFKANEKKYSEAISILQSGKEFITDTLTYLLKLSSLHLLIDDTISAKKTFKDANKICDDALLRLELLHPIKNQVTDLIEN